MKRGTNNGKSANRRSFLKTGVTAAGGAGLLTNASAAFGWEESSGQLPKGDAAILRFLAAAEIIESDLWIQYNELGGVQDNEIPGLGGSGALSTLPLCKTLTEICLNTSTTTPTMRSATRRSSTPILLRKARIP